MSAHSRTPTRRSQRFQPIVCSTPTRSTDKAISWVGKPVRVRPTVVTDIHFEDGIQLDSGTEMETFFFQCFTRSAPVVMRMGKGKTKQPSTSETYGLGDTVLVTSNGKLPSVGVIISMWDVRDDDQNPIGNIPMKVKIHWFLRPSELARIRARREHLQNEIYFSLASTVIITPGEIIQHCSVTSQCPDSTASMAKTFRHPSMLKATSGKEVFFCNLSVDGRRCLFYGLDWDAHRNQAMASDVDEVDAAWCIETENVGNRQSKRAKQRVKGEGSTHEDDSGDEYQEPVESDEEPESHVEVESEEDWSDHSKDRDELIPKTPSKKRKAVTQTATPRSTKRVKKSLAIPTPHSKAALRARAKTSQSKRLAIRPPPPELAYDFANLNHPKDPWLRAMQVLHVGARPDALPCREEEFGRILRAVEGLLEEGSGGCVYVSGVPGTGKTATVHGIVRELKRMAERNEVNPFTYVEINGLRIPEPSAAYSLLWEAVSGHDTATEGHLRISSKEALKQLTKHFGHALRAGPGGHACVVLMDELDQLVTTKQDVVYNFFNWPTLVGSKLVVIAVANTMDLPERVMSGRVRSRLGMVRINFQPYTTPQLEKIVNARLQAAKEGLTEIPCDVIGPDGIKFAAMKVSSISGDARRVLDICRRAVELVQPASRTARTEDVRDVIKIMQNSPTAAFLRDCSLHERIMLASLLKCGRRDGIEEVKWGDVQYQHLVYTNILTGDDDSTRKPSMTELMLVLDSLLASHAILIEGGAISSRKADGERKVILNIEQTEVERVLGELGGPRWKNALGM